MKPSLTPLALLLTAAVALTGCESATLHPNLPHLEKRDGMTKLIVDGQPFICVAGELRNTSSSDPEAMAATWPRMAKANLNTVLSVVSWDLVEPTEGHFDFSIIDQQLQGARDNHLRLVLLWMGSWKNGLSHFPPEWVKADQDRFPRVKNADGKSLEILSTLSKNNRDADARAFAAVMRHLRQVDSTQHTVIAIQVENEVGVLGSTRDFSEPANQAFNQPVPAKLTSYLESHKQNLLPEITAIWNAAGNKTTGTWEEVFGKNIQRNQMPPVPNSPTRTARPADAELFNHTDEIFMAWNYSQYIGHVAAAGKREYPLPMYVNAWIVQPNDIGPGDYPSGGAEPLVHDIWRAGAPAIDILAPDIYLPQYAEVLQKFARNGNPAFNPETAQNGNNAWLAFTQLNALCFSPFGIDNINPDGPFAKTYAFLNSISGALAQAQGKTDAIKLITLKPDENPGKVDLGDYTFDFTPAATSRPRRRPTPAASSTETPATPDAAPARRASVGASFLNAPFLVIIQTAPNEYYFATNTALPFRVSPRTPNGKIAAAATIDRGSFKDGHWTLAHRYNGDDIMGLGYDLSAAANNNQSGTEVPLTPPPETPAQPVIMRVHFYQYQ